MGLPSGIWMLRNIAGFFGARWAHMSLRYNSLKFCISRGQPPVEAHCITVPMVQIKFSHFDLRLMSRTKSSQPYARLKTMLHRWAPCWRVYKPLFWCDSHRQRTVPKTCDPVEWVVHSCLCRCWHKVFSMAGKRSDISYQAPPRSVPPNLHGLIGGFRDCLLPCEASRIWHYWFLRRYSQHHRCWYDLGNVKGC